MAELADALDLGSSVNRRAGSTPVIRTRKNKSREHCSQLLFLTEANRVLEPGFRSRLPRLNQSIARLKDFRLQIRSIFIKKLVGQICLCLSRIPPF